MKDEYINHSCLECKHYKKELFRENGCETTYNCWCSQGLSILRAFKSNYCEGFIRE